MFGSLLHLSFEAKEILPFAKNVKKKHNFDLNTVKIISTVQVYKIGKQLPIQFYIFAVSKSDTRRSFPLNFLMESAPLTTRSRLFDKKAPTIPWHKGQFLVHTLYKKKPEGRLSWYINTFFKVVRMLFTRICILITNPPKHTRIGVGKANQVRISWFE